MATQTNHLISAAEYLAAERVAEAKSEYYRGQVFAMAGGTPAYSAIAVNIAAVLKQALGGQGCTVYNSDLKIGIVLADAYVYPDVSVVCGPPELVPGTNDVLANPVLVAEVLSPATADHDRGAKFSHYRRIPSLRAYLIVDQMQVLIEHWGVQQGRWTLLGEVREHSGVIELTFARGQLLVSDIYSGVVF